MHVTFDGEYSIIIQRALSTEVRCLHQDTVIKHSESDTESDTDVWFLVSSVADFVDVLKVPLR